MLSTPPAASEVQEFTSITERVSCCVLVVSAIGFVALSVFIGMIVADMVS